MKKLIYGGLLCAIDHKNKDVYMYNDTVGGFLKVINLTKDLYEEFTLILRENLDDTTFSRDQLFFKNMYNSLITRLRKRSDNIKKKVMLYLDNVAKIIESDHFPSKYVSALIRNYMRDLDSENPYNKEDIEDLLLRDNWLDLALLWETDLAEDCCCCCNNYCCSDDGDLEDDDELLFLVNWLVVDALDEQLLILLDILLAILGVSEKLDRLNIVPYIPLTDTPDPGYREDRWNVRWLTGTGAPQGVVRDK